MGSQTPRVSERRSPIGFDRTMGPTRTRANLLGYPSVGTEKTGSRAYLGLGVAGLRIHCPNRIGCCR